MVHDTNHLTADPVTESRNDLLVPGYAVRDAIEACYERDWTDGLPVVPCTEELLASFLARTSRDPDEVLLDIPHLNRSCTVRHAAINAVMAGCRPDYFPVVVAAWDSFSKLGIGRNALWQSTTGSAPLVLVNGPVASQIGINGKGNVFGSGFRANATIGRTIRLTTVNILGLRPQVLDQATQGTPAKYTCCISENEDDSPWPAFHVEQGFRHQDSVVTAMLIRGSLYMEARHTANPAQLLWDFVDSICRTGRMVAAGGSVCLAFCPEHANLLADEGWSKKDIKQFIYERSTRSPEALDRVGKGGRSRHTHWRVPIEHPDAVVERGVREPLYMLSAPSAIEIIVAGAPNAGVSTILETIGPRGGRQPSVIVNTSPDLPGSTQTDTQ